MEYAKSSALDHARERFRAGLVKRAQELRPLTAAFSSDPGARVARAALQRRLHTLLASAQLFEEVALVELLQTVVNRLDAVGLSGDLWREGDRQALFSLLAYLGGAADDELGAFDEVEPELGMNDSGPRVIATQLPAPSDMSDMREPPPRERSTRDSFAPAWSTVSGPADNSAASSVLLVRVLLVCSRPHIVTLRPLLEDAPVEILHAADPEQALALLQNEMPACALVAAEFATLPDIDLVRRLRMDPVARLDGVYLLLPPGVSGDAEFVRQCGADGVLSEPLTVEALLPMLDRASRSRGRGGLRTLNERPVGTVDEIASYVAEEVRLGIAEGLRAGLGERIELSNTDELTAAAQSVIGRVRAHLTAQSHGRISFPGGAGVSAPDPVAPQWAADTAAARQPPLDLHGIRVLVADDDPAVLWFFAGILREAGAEVSQARDGRVALDLARRKRPHAILSDILMPKIDGIELCRELRRDVISERVPVVLLSWKDDLLERVRELASGASAYLRKDARSEDVLGVLAQALGLRLQLTAALRQPGETSGRVEDVGIVALLESVAEARPDARITVQDAWSLFEIELRQGSQIAVTRTSADGSFTRSERALVQLLGVTAGRYSVVASQTTLRGSRYEPLASALLSASDSVSSVIEAVSDARLRHVTLLSFDEEVVSYLLGCTPTRLHEVVARFRQASTSAGQLIEEGAFTPAELEGHLRELARRGAITGVWDDHGDDMVAAALHARAPEPPLDQEDIEELEEELDEPESPVDVEEEERPSDAFGFAPVRSNEVTFVADFDLSKVTATTTLQGMGAVRMQLPGASHPSPQLPAATWSRAEPDAEPELHALRRSLATPRHPDADVEEISFELLQHGASFDSVVSFRPLEREVPLDLRTIRVPKPTISIGQRARREGARLTLTLVGLAALGYVSAVQLEKNPFMRSDFTKLWTRWGQQTVQPLAAMLGRETSVSSGVDPRLVALGVVLPYVDVSYGVKVAGDEGLLVVQHAGHEQPAEVLVDGRSLGQPPVAIPLTASPHQLTFKHDHVATQHTVMIYAGKTRAITLPLSSP